MGCFNTANFEFPESDIENSLKKGGLLSIEIELSLRCNFRCPYCYVPDTSYIKDELSNNEIYDVILQAKELGAQKIIILGGEPTIYRDILKTVRFISQNGLQVEMFSNGSGITLDFAKELFANRVRVVLKKNTMSEKIQDELTGKKGAFKIINQAFKNLQSAGYPSENGFFAISTIICKQNIKELPDFWQWLRNQNIVPYFEIITPQANAKINNWLQVPKNQLKQLFETIAKIDRDQYGFNWEPQPPLVGNRCLRHQFSCLITSNGIVTPCVGVTIPLGNIREQSLSDIIKNSVVLNNLKNHRSTIKGVCSRCEKSDGCYGCRGAAYQLTGDYLESDPLCWFNT